MAESSKVRMNLAAIKRVDPYAKDIVDSSSHVAFYTFNSERNEWEKTDVEGAFFIYSRNAQPFHSIFINNRINTTSFVEPVTNQLEIQSQPPFLLYRNERSRIRGFWFYNSEECNRIGNLVKSISQTNFLNYGAGIKMFDQRPTSENIFNLLFKAQEEFNNKQEHQSSIPTGNVMKFFACAKSTTADSPLLNRVIPTTLSVEQIEMQQRAKTPRTESQKLDKLEQLDMSGISGSTVHFLAEKNYTDNATGFSEPQQINSDKSNGAVPDLSNESKNFDMSKNNASIKPSLMPPTMFDGPSNIIVEATREPLSQTELVQAFTYLISNDTEFVQKLHNAYLKMYNKHSFETYQ